MKKISRQDILFILTVFLFYGILQLFGITCPIKYITGVSCPGCGMTRAWFSFVFHHNFSQAMAFHPLFLLVPPAVLIFLFRSRMPDWIYRILFICIITLFLGVYLKRQLVPDDLVVVFDPENGLIYKCLSYLYHLTLGVS